MSRTGWMQLKRETPLDFGSGDPFTEAQVLESKLSRLQGGEGDQMVKLIEYRSDLNSLIQDLLREIGNVKDEIEEYELASDTVYKYIETYVVMFRQERVDRLINDSQSMSSSGGLSGSGIQSHNVATLKGNMESMLTTLRESISDANRRFWERKQVEEFEEVDENLVYLSILATSFRSSISLYGNVDLSGDDEVFDIVEGTAEQDEEETSEMLENFSKDIDEVDDAIKEVEEELEGL